MSLITKEIEVGILGTELKRYEKLGYDIPREYDNQGRYRIVRGSKIKIKIEDLAPTSAIKVDVKCDYCGLEKKVKHRDYNKNIAKNNGLYICDKGQLHKELAKEKDYDILVSQLKEFLIHNDRFPLYYEFDGKNLLSYSKVCEIAKKYNKTLQQIMADIDCFKSVSDIRYYNKYVEKYKELLESSENYSGIYVAWHNSSVQLPRPDWMVKNAPLNSGVCDSDSFMKWAGIYTNTPTKGQAIELIYKMATNHKTPLMYDDFRGNKYGTVSITTVRKYWGSLNKMKTELGLEIIQDSMIDKQLSKEETINQIQGLCNKAKLECRDFITTREFDNKNGTADYGTLSKMIKKYFNMSFSDYIKTLGFRTGEQGIGTSFKFEDGEITTSQFEFMFSNFLKEYGLKYNINYYRDVKYDNFISNYKGNMNCDYLINYNNKTIYIEIAGIIEAYKNWYYEDKIITKSKSKEKYRLKLKQKEQMLKENNLTYFILFPCDLTRKNFISILEDSSLELKNKIEKFMKNNIDWVKIQEIGELKYKENELSCYNQKVVDYN